MKKIAEIYEGELNSNIRCIEILMRIALSALTVVE